MPDPVASRSTHPAQIDSNERILNAAEVLFAEKGFDAVSINDIAAAAEVCKANVFHHFKSKHDLYLAVVRRACEGASAHLEEMGTEQIPLDERLGTFAAVHLQELLQHARVTRLILRELLGGNPRAGQDLAEQVYGEKFSRFVNILRSGQKAGTLRPDVDPAMVATILLGADVFFFEAQDVLHHFPEVRFSRQPARFSRDLTDILLHGILSPDSKTKRKRT